MYRRSPLTPVLGITFCVGCGRDSCLPPETRATLAKWQSVATGFNADYTTPRTGGAHDLPNRRARRHRYDDEWGLKVTYQDHFRLSSDGSGPCSCVVSIVFDGETCASPGPLEFVVDSWHAGAAELDRVSQVAGFCSATSSSALPVDVVVQARLEARSRGQAECTCSASGKGERHFWKWRRSCWMVARRARRRSPSRCARSSRPLRSPPRSRRTCPSTARGGRATRRARRGGGSAGGCPRSAGGWP